MSEWRRRKALIRRELDDLGYPAMEPPNPQEGANDVWEYAERVADLRAAMGLK